MDLKEYFKKDEFAKYVGIELLDVSPGYAKAKMEITNNHLNSLKTVQGGAIFTLADLAFAAASNSHETIAVALNVNISFLKAKREGTLFAEAKEVSINSKIATYNINIIDENKDLIAIFQGMAYRKKDNLL